MPINASRTNWKNLQRGIASCRRPTRLHNLATWDGLTGLLNHRALLERLGEEWERSKRHSLPLALLLLDLDYFKDYNDAHGHLAGDAALQQVAQVLRSATREADTLARYGGEEFFVVLPQTNMDGALVMAERIRRGTEGSGQSGWPLTVSIGVCVQEAAITKKTALALLWMIWAWASRPCRC